MILVSAAVISYSVMTKDTDTLIITNYDSKMYYEQLSIKHAGGNISTPVMSIQKIFSIDKVNKSLPSYYIEFDCDKDNIRILDDEYNHQWVTVSPETTEEIAYDFACHTKH